MTITKIHELTIKKYGYTACMNKTIQELNELTEEIRDNKNGDNNKAECMEEIADVRNMLDKLEIILDINNAETCKIQREKMVRTYKRLTKD